MTTHDALLPAVVLQRKAVVYVRQSTPQQVQLNLESQRRQYELVEVARRRGFTDIEVIDDDLGRTASGAVERPGFDRLVRSEEHTSELQSRLHLVCRLLLEKNNHSSWLSHQRHVPSLQVTPT